MSAKEVYLAVIFLLNLTFVKIFLNNNYIKGGIWGKALDRLADLLNFAVIPANIVLKGLT